MTLGEGKRMKRAVKSLAAALFVCFAFWVGGFDFNERGFWAFYLLVISSAAAWLAWSISE